MPSKWAKLFLAIIALLTLNACDKTLRKEHYPINDAERKALAEFELKAIENLRVASLSGHDQDWDDTVRAIHYAGLEACCSTVFVEYENHGPTGRVFLARISGEPEPIK